LSDAPPSREGHDFLHVADSVEVKILTTSGMIGAREVPQVMIVDSFHHRCRRRRAWG
jgi:hypothetical protein